MATIQTKTTLRSFFETGDTPTQEQFADLIETLIAFKSTGLTEIDTIDEITTDNGVVLDGVRLKDDQIQFGSIETQKMKMSRVDIGFWNMFEAGGGSGTSTVTVTLPTEFQFPDSVTIGIYQDAKPGQLESYSGNATGDSKGSWRTDSSGNIVIQINSSSPFNSALYESGSTNRGNLVLTKWSTV